MRKNFRYELAWALSDSMRTEALPLQSLNQALVVDDAHIL